MRRGQKQFSLLFVFWSARRISFARAAFIATPLPVPPPQGGREPCGTHLRNSQPAEFEMCACPSAEAGTHFFGRVLGRWLPAFAGIQRAQVFLARTQPLSSPRRRGPITTKVSVVAGLATSHLLRRMLGWTAPRRHRCARMRSLQISYKRSRP